MAKAPTDIKFVRHGPPNLVWSEPSRPGSFENIRICWATDGNVSLKAAIDEVDYQSGYGRERIEVALVQAWNDPLR